MNMPSIANGRHRPHIVAGVVVLLVSLVTGGLANIPGPASAAFPGTNGKIAFRSNQDVQSEIYVMNPDGTGLTNVTNHAAFDYTPSVSADGQKIVFASDRDGNDEIYVMDADGTGQTRLTNNAASDFRPSFSPDGQKVAFESHRDGNFEVYVMNTDGTGQTRLTNNVASDFHPVFSPDGEKIAFARSAGGISDIYLMNTDGTGQTNITQSAGLDREPAFSPDGQKIAVTNGLGGNDEIYVMNADGSGRSNLTNNASAGTHDHAPEFSPDGQLVVFTSHRDGNSDIYVMSATDGSNQIRLTTHPSVDTDPDWGSLVEVITPPDTTIVSDPFEETSDRTPTFTFTGSGDVSGFECSVDGADFLPCTSPFTTEKLKRNKQHTFAVRAVGPGGTDPTPAQRVFNVTSAAK